MSKIKLTPEVKEEIQKDIANKLHPKIIAEKHGISLTLLYRNFDVNYLQNRKEKTLKKILDYRKQKLTHKQISTLVNLSECTIRKYLKRAYNEGKIDFLRLKTRSQK